MFGHDGVPFAVWWGQPSLHKSISQALLEIDFYVYIYIVVINQVRSNDSMRQQLRPFEAFQVLFRIDGCNEVGAKAFDWGLENKDKLIKLFEMADGRDHLWALIFDQKLVRVHVREDGEEHTPDVSLVRQGASSYSVMEHLEQAVKFSEILGPLTIEDINGISLRVHPGNSASELYDMFKTKMQNNQPSKQR